ncbi:MAG: 50S ribosomal protein L3 N(5)-glutamine methyltransferase [Rubrivivax sp.]|nr:50S ribosomal protein L3 N(5)-glutamine methyltransferase [Rubrivivax sp.]
MNLFECVQQAGRQLEAAGVAFGHGTINAFDEAAWLVLWRLGLPLDALDEHASRRLSAAEQQQVLALIDERIRTRRPAAYLTGEAWLQGVPFFVDERTIVPRSLIAEPLAAGDIDALLGREPELVLDLCTGNGSLAVLAAMAWPRVQVLATDLSDDALAVARRNVQRHGLAARIELRQGDGLAALHAAERFDLVLCNPPYVNAASMSELPPEFRAEPALALAGGGDGMDFVRPLLAGIAAHLAPGGVLVLEVGHERAHFEAAFPRLEAVWLDTSAGGDAVLLLAREALLVRATPPRAAGQRGRKAAAR